MLWLGVTVWCIAAAAAEGDPWGVTLPAPPRSCIYLNISIHESDEHMYPSTASRSPTGTDGHP